MRKTAALILTCAAVTLASMAGVTASAQTPGDNKASGNAADSSTSASNEPLVINGCPIWPYTRCPGADLRHADLVGKNLAGSDLRGADLTRADLRGANLAAANLEGANLTGARLSKATAANTDFKNARFIGADLEGARLMRSDFSGAEFIGSNLEMARFNHAWFVGTRFISNDLQEAKLAATNLKDAVFEGNFVRYTLFHESNMEGCKGCKKEWE
mgnify:CR=1 FL=1